MTHHAYHFAAVSIQSFLTAGGKLKELVGASEMVERLSGELLDAAMASLGMDLNFSRRGGGAFTALGNREELERLQGVWTLAMAQFAPGLGFRQALGEGATPALAIGNAITNAQHQLPRPRMPAANPLVERAPRTGLPATRMEGSEYLDAAAGAKRRDAFSKGRELGLRFLPQPGALRWPLLLSPEEEAGNVDLLPLPPDNQVIAVVHADGNGMGAMLASLNAALGEQPDYPDRMLGFSDAITCATRNAAQKATALLIPKAQGEVLPGRPVVLGGDDLTMIVRADLALTFTQTFLMAFEEESRQALAALTGLPAGFPTGMTACAGIAFIKARNPSPWP